MRTLLTLGLLASLLACSDNSSTDTPAEAFDVLLHGGNLYNGDDALPVVGDVGIRGQRIVALGGDLSAHPAEMVLDVTLAAEQRRRLLPNHARHLL